MQDINLCQLQTSSAMTLRFKISVLCIIKQETRRIIAKILSRVHSFVDAVQPILTTFFRNSTFSIGDDFNCLHLRCLVIVVEHYLTYLGIKQTCLYCADIFEKIIEMFSLFYVRI